MERNGPWTTKRLAMVADIIEGMPREDHPVEDWPTWNGTVGEQRELRKVAGSHSEDTDWLDCQRILDGLLCARRNAGKWIAREHGNLTQTTVSLLAAVLVIRWSEVLA